MSVQYPGNLIPIHANPISIYDGHYVSPNILQSIDQLNTTGQVLRIFFDPLALSEQLGNGQIKEHYTSINNHFQSMVRHRSGDFLIMSGGDKSGQRAHLLVIKLESYRQSNRLSKTNVIGSNLIVPHQWKLDHLKHLFIIEHGAFWHAGGISLLGDLLTVPLEGGNHSRIVFIDATDPMQLRRLPHFINRQNAKAGSVSVLKLSTHQYLCAVWSDSDSQGDRFDFYLSAQSDIQSPFKLLASVQASQINNKGNIKPRLQSMQFIVDQHDDIYISGMDNSSQLSLGTNRIFLFKINIDIVSTIPNSQLIDDIDMTIDMLRCKHLQKGGRYYNLGSAPGAYADQAGTLRYYCGYTWKNNDHLQLAEFSTRLSDQQTAISSIHHARLELYTDKNNQGRQLIIYGNRHPNISSVKNTLIANNGNIGDSISSIKFILPVNSKYILYEDDDFNQGNSSKNELTLLGTGKVEKIHDLKNHQLINQSSFASLKFGKSFNDKTSSLRLMTS